MKMALPEVEYDRTAVCDEEQESGAVQCCEHLIYTVFSEVIESSLLGRYCGYGISVIDAQGYCLRTVHDITCEREPLEALVELCNRLDLSFCHLDDVIEDFLA